MLPGIASYVFFGGALILVASAASSGESLQPGVALEASREKLRDGFWATLRGLGIFAGLAITILGLPWAISRATRWIFTLQAVVLDDQTNQTALNHSALLVVNLGWWVVFWRFLFLCLVIAIQVLRYTD
ncbi:MAG TPA: hypothetical protein VJB57_05145 [Dehalococcoidia bacterium]|nr:hypothetical protein [Dehalococcoidia bacterium]